MPSVGRAATALAQSVHLSRQFLLRAHVVSVPSDTMKKTGLILVLAAGSLAAWMLWSLSDGGARLLPIEPATQAADTSAPRERDAVAEIDVHESLPPRATVELPAVAPTQASDATARVESAATIVRGRVLDTTGNPLGGVRLALRGRPHALDAGSAANGQFEFALPKPALFDLSSESFELEVAPGQRWTNACGTPFTRERCTDLLLVAAPAIEIGGVVLDESGLAIEGALISLTIRSTKLREFPLQLDRASPLQLETASGSDGGFRLNPVPALSGCGLYASLGDSLRGDVELPTATTLDLRIVLRASRSESLSALRGIVQSLDAQPVGGATVVYGHASTKSAANGSFELALPDWTPEGVPLVAAKKGFQAAIVNDVEDRIARKDDSIIVLRLGPPTLEIRGRVLHSDGKPAKGWTVVIADGVEVSRGSVPATFAEGLAAGSPKGTHSQTTNSAGEFTLRGLSARGYTVRAWDDESLLALRAVDVAAGTQDLVLRVPADATWPELRGQVVDRRGAAVAGAHVDLELVTFQSGGGESWESSDGVDTAADGRFVLKNVPKSEVRISVSGDSLIGKNFELSELALEHELRLSVDLRCHFRLLCERGERIPDRASLLDDGGKLLSVFTYQSQGWSSSTQFPVQAGGATHAMAVSERACTLVLYLNGEELERVPVTLLPGQVSEVRF